MEVVHEKYYCISCGNPVKSLYKEYSSTVLKLTECAHCKKIADKYVEYDLVIVIIDIILLRIMAYRHILLNTKFKNFWKLFIALILLESYSNWVLAKEMTAIGQPKDLNKTSYIDEELIYLDDLKFYEMTLKTALGFMSFIFVAYYLTLFYSYLRKKDFTSLLLIWKAVTLSTSATFLLLPSLIWEKHFQEFHMLFVSLYTTLSQLLAYKVNMDIPSRERIASVKPGHWIWDEYTDGLMFILHERDKQQLEPSAAVSVSSVFQQRDAMFKYVFGSASLMKFKKICERKVKPATVNVVILQDCKDVALYTCDVKLLTLEFINLFHSRTVDKFLRSLIVYFQYYLQIWKKLQFRRIEAGRKLRQPSVTLVENNLRDDLADLRSMVGRDYAAILTGVGDARKFHHMKGENNVSLSDKDRKHFEMLFKMATRVVWIALKKRNLVLIEKEFNRLLKTNLFSPIEHDPIKKNHFVALPREDKILKGKVCKTEKKLLSRSPCIQELVYDAHDYRMLAIGVTDIEDRTARQAYLEIAYSAPEELLLELDMGIGILGIPKKFFDLMLNEDLSATRKRSSTLKPIPVFIVPPFIQYDDTKIYDTLPKRPCRFRESEVSAIARREQCKMWQEYVKRQGQYRSGASSFSDKISTPSYTTLRSMNKSVSSNRSNKEKMSDQHMEDKT